MHLFARDPTLHHWTRSWLAHGDSFLRANWHWSHAQCQRLHASLSPVAAPSYWRAAPVTPSCSTRASPLALTGPAGPCGPVRPFSTPYAWAHLGLTPSILSPLFRTVKYPRTAAFCHTGPSWAQRPPSAGPTGPSPCPSRILRTPSSSISPAGLAAITSSHSLLHHPPPTPTTGLILYTRLPTRKSTSPQPPHPGPGPRCSTPRLLHLSRAPCRHSKPRPPPSRAALRHPSHSRRSTCTTS